MMAKAATLPEKLRNAPAATPKPVANEPTEPARKEPKPAAGPLIAARKLPLPKTGKILLQTHGGEIRWRNLFVREIPPAEAKKLLAAVEGK